MHKRNIVFETGAAFGDDENALWCGVRVTVSVTDEFYKAFVTHRKDGLNAPCVDALAFRLIKDCVEEFVPEFLNQAEAPFLRACAASRQGDNSIPVKAHLSYIAGCHDQCWYKDLCKHFQAGAFPP